MGLVALYLVRETQEAHDSHSPQTSHAASGEGPVRSGGLVVDSDPGGAQVTVEGVPGTRRAPARYEGLPTGVRRRIELTLPGRRPWVGVVVLERRISFR